MSFPAWYLEIIKPEYQKPVDRITLNATIAIFEKLLKLIHPFMPFITEEIWQLLSERKDGESIMVAQMPESEKFNRELISDFESVKETISAVRTVRKIRIFLTERSLNFLSVLKKNHLMQNFFRL